MKNIQLFNHIQTAAALINKDLIIVDVNNAFQKRNGVDKEKLIGTKCFKSAYSFIDNCSSCPVAKSFRTKKTSTTIHHFWIKNKAVVEEVTSTPIINENGDVIYVIEEFHDITKLLGLNKGIIAVCSYCRKIRDEDGSWLSFESYFLKHTGANFSHGICEDCKASEASKLD